MCYPGAHIVANGLNVFGFHRNMVRGCKSKYKYPFLNMIDRFFLTVFARFLLRNDFLTFAGFFSRLVVASAVFTQPDIIIEYTSPAEAPPRSQPCGYAFVFANGCDTFFPNACVVLTFIAFFAILNIALRFARIRPIQETVRHHLQTKLVMPVKSAKPRTCENDQSLDIFFPYVLCKRQRFV